MPMARQDTKSIGKGNAIFINFSNGVQTNRDTWVYNFSRAELQENILRFIDTYNLEVDRWNNRQDRKANVDNFLLDDEEHIKWSSRLKECLLRGRKEIFSTKNIRYAAYRPFCKQSLYFNNVLIHRQGQFPRFFPTINTEKENRAIWLKIGSNWEMFALITNGIADQMPQGGSQCFPFYVYDEDGSNRRENISDWALAQFKEKYEGERQKDEERAEDSAFRLHPSALTKWDIFYYVYALLHSPAYREKYAANLKRDLPHIPFVEDLLNPKGLPDVNIAELGEGTFPTNNLSDEETFRVSDGRVLFWRYVTAGKKLAELHVHYEAQPEYPLEMVENESTHLNWRVEKMRLSKDKTEIQYNDFLTLKGIPAEAFEYRLGNRSALDWVIDQYRVTTDPRSKIVNDPNDSDDPQYIVRLVKKVVTVSLETVSIVKGLGKSIG